MRLDHHSNLSNRPNDLDLGHWCLLLVDVEAQCAVHEIYPLLHIFSSGDVGWFREYVDRRDEGFSWRRAAGRKVVGLRVDGVKGLIGQMAILIVLRRLSCTLVRVNLG